MRDGGKGDKQRPVFDKEAFEANWETIFGKKSKPKVEEVDEGVYLIEVNHKKDPNDIL